MHTSKAWINEVFKKKYLLHWRIPLHLTKNKILLKYWFQILRETCTRISLHISFHFFIDFWSLWRSRSSSTIVEAPQLRKRLFTTFSWPYFYPMSNLHFKAYTMLLCLLSNKNTTHVFRSTKLNKKEKKLYVDALQMRGAYLVWTTWTKQWCCFS